MQRDGKTVAGVNSLCQPDFRKKQDTPVRRIEGFATAWNTCRIDLNPLSTAQSPRAGTQPAAGHAAPNISHPRRPHPIFRGLPEGESHLELEELLEQLGRKSGMSRALIKHFVLLLEWSRPQDWRTGAQPIVWLSVKETAYRLGISSVAGATQREDAAQPGRARLEGLPQPSPLRIA